MQVPVDSAPTDIAQDETAHDCKVVTNDPLKQINAVQVTYIRLIKIQESINRLDYRFGC